MLSTISGAYHGYGERIYFEVSGIRIMCIEETTEALGERDYSSTSAVFKDSTHAGV